MPTWRASTFLLLILSAVSSAQTKAIFYMTARPDSVESFLAHAAQIDILIPEIYSTDAEGVVWGEPDPRVLEAAAKHRVPVMPIIVNPGFKQEPIHALLASAAAQARLSRTLLDECRQHHYYGIQFDFENVPFSDRDALTALVRDTTALLGRDDYKLSIATVHKSSEYPGESDYAHWIYANWRGAFDLAA